MISDAWCFLCSFYVCDIHTHNKMNTYSIFESVGNLGYAFTRGDFTDHYIKKIETWLPMEL